MVRGSSRRAGRHLSCGLTRVRQDLVTAITYRPASSSTPRSRASARRRRSRAGVEEPLAPRSARSWRNPGPLRTGTPGHDLPGGGGINLGQRLRAVISTARRVSRLGVAVAVVEVRDRATSASSPRGTGTVSYSAPGLGVAARSLPPARVLASNGVMSRSSTGPGLGVVVVVAGTGERGQRLLPMGRACVSWTACGPARSRGWSTRRPKAGPGCWAGGAAGACGRTSGLPTARIARPGPRPDRAGEENRREGAVLSADMFPSFRADRRACWVRMSVVDKNPGRGHLSAGRREAGSLRGVLRTQLGQGGPTPGEPSAAVSSDCMGRVGDVLGSGTVSVFTGSGTPTVFPVLPRGTGTPFWAPGVPRGDLEVWVLNAGIPGIPFWAHGSGLESGIVVPVRVSDRAANAPARRWSRRWPGLPGPRRRGGSATGSAGPSPPRPGPPPRRRSGRRRG